MSDRTLEQAVATFARAALRVPEARMTDDLPVSAHPADAPWRDYGSVRERYYRVYQDMREHAVTVARQRQAAGRAMTAAQHILAQHQRAYRDLCGALAAVRDDELDREPAPGEWPLRTVLAHVLGAEAGFHSLVAYALERGRKHPEWPAVRPDDWRPAGPDVSGSLADILARFDALHTRVLEDFAGVNDAELDWPSRFWEGYDLPLSFRLLRFDAHLREHTIQVDKTLAGLGHTPAEAERLIRLVYDALGEAEGAAIGADDIATDARAALAERVVAAGAALPTA